MTQADSVRRALSHASQYEPLARQMFERLIVPRLRGSWTEAENEERGTVELLYALRLEFGEMVLDVSQRIPSHLASRPDIESRKSWVEDEAKRMIGQAFVGWAEGNS